MATLCPHSPSQVDFLAAAQRKLEGDAEVRERKVTDLQRNKIELLDR